MDEDEKIFNENVEMIFEVFEELPFRLRLVVFGCYIFNPKYLKKRWIELNKIQ